MNNHKILKNIMMKNYFIPITATAFIFILYFFVGITIYKDYGISWDEGTERFSGIVNTKVILQTINKDLPKKFFEEKLSNSVPPVSNYGDRYYGVILQFPQLLLDSFARDDKAMWETRHLFMFLFFFLSVIFFFLTLQIIFENLILSLIGTLLLILTPRFFAESFYNIKDIGFFSAFTIAFYFLIRFFAKPRFIFSFLLGIIIAFASAVRIVGIVFLPVAIGFLLVSSIRRIIPWRNFIRMSIVLCASTFGFLFIFYPASWSNPLTFFYEVIKKMSHYPWNGDVLFLGKIYNSHSLPWYYLPIWIIVSTPILIIILSLCGILFSFSKTWFIKQQTKVHLLGPSSTV
jgi:hypothetical protein